MMFYSASNTIRKKLTSRNAVVEGMAPSKPMAKMAQKKSSGSGFFGAIGEAFTNLVSSSNKK
jgi:hypothetical protein